MYHAFNHTFRSFFIIAAVLSGSWSSVQAETIKFGIIGNQQDQQRHKALLEHLNRSSENDFEIVILPTLDELTAAFASRKVRIAAVGSVAYLKLKDTFGAVPLVKGAPNAAIVFVRTDSTIQELSQLRGKRLALGYERSTTSNLIPRLLLWQNGFKKSDLTSNRSVFVNDASKIFVDFAGSHAAVVEEVIAGDADAGAVVDAIFENNKDRGLRVLHKSEAYPGFPLVCHPNESRQFKTEMRTIFNAYRAPVNVDHHHFDTGASNAKDEDYNSIRYLCNIVLGDHYEIN